MGNKKKFHPFFMLLLVEGAEKECLPKFGILIFILAHEIKQALSLLSKLEALYLLAIRWTFSRHTISFISLGLHN